MTSSVTEPDRPLTGHKTNIVLSGRNNTDIINSCKEKVLSGNSLTPDEAMLLAESGDKSRLFAAACKIRRHFCGDEYELCSIINARSGRCAEDCKWCAQSAFHSTDIDEYELVEKNLAIKTAWNNEKLGIHKFSLVTSGKKATKNVLNDLCDMYREIKEKTGIELCASMGLLDKEELLMLKGAGVKNYHCNLETSRAIFGKLCSTHTYDDKINTIELAKEAGLTVCSGCIIGMGESMRDRINIAFELKNLGVNSVPVNVLHPVKGTPLEHISSPADEEILTTFAVFRFILPAAQIRLAGGRCRISHIMPEIIRAGVNAAITGNLLTTTGAGIIDDIRLFENEGFRRKI
ncbi:MAG: biotin synthase BioB [Bacteroidetes bacterium]|nr:biotin synthase BioB [Bacteroidota bacterium]